MFINGLSLASFFHKYIFWNQPVSSTIITSGASDAWRGKKFLLINKKRHKLSITSGCYMFFSDIFEILITKCAFDFLKSDHLPFFELSNHEWIENISVLKSKNNKKING